MAITLSSPRLSARQVAATVANASGSAPMATPVWGAMPLDQGTLGVTLTLDEGLAGTNYAPHRAAFDLAVTGFDGEDEQLEYWRADFHRVWYHHNFGDPGARFTVAERLEEEHRDRNVAVGQIATHVYRRPGSYFWYVYCYDRAGNWGSASTVITVKEDDYTADETVVLAHDGNFTGAPYAAARNRLTTWAQWIAWTPAAGVTRVKLWIKRGGTYVRPVDMAKGGAYRLTIAPYGTGARPIIDIRSGGLGSSYTFVNFPSLKMSGLRFVGGWDAVADMPHDATEDVRYQTIVVSAQQAHVDVLVDDCEDIDTYMGARVVASTGHFCLHEYKRTGHKDFTCLGNINQGTFSFIGCAEVQRLDAANGAMNRDLFNTGDGHYRYLRNSHNGFRIECAKTIIIYACDLFSRMGWTYQNFVLDNPILRLNSSAATMGGLQEYRLIIARCQIESSIGNGDVGGVAIPGNGLLTQCRLLAAPGGGGGHDLSQIGWTVRDNIFIVSDTPLPTGVSPTNTFLATGTALPAGQTEEWATKMEVYNNTMVDLRVQARQDSANAFVPIRKARPTISVTEVNNIIHRPNLTVPVVGDAPLDLTPLGYEARYAGVKVGFAWWPNHHTLAAAVAPGGSVLVPYGKDWYGTTMTAAAFAQAWKRHGVFLSGTGTGIFDAFRGTASFAFEAGGVRITNSSTTTWPTGAVVSVMLDQGRGGMAMDTRIAPPAGTMRRYGVTPTSAAYRSATGALVSLTDYLGGWRPGTQHRDAPAGQPSRGAMEIAA